MSVWSRIKRWFTGGGGGSSSSRSSSRPSSSNRSSTKRASRVTNYGGGGSRSVRDYSKGGYSSDYQSYYNRRELERNERKKKQEQTTKAFASISNSMNKRTDALSSGNSISNYADSKKSNLDKAVGRAGTGNGTTRALAKIAAKTAANTKANPPDAKLKQSQIKDAKTLKRDTTKALKEIARTDPERNTEALIKSGDYERMPKAKNMNTPSAENRAALRVTPQGLEKRMQDPAYKRLYSGSRGIMSGVTWGTSNRLLAGDKNDEYDREMEKVYQANKSHGAELAGEFAGSLVSFGKGAGATKKLVGGATRKGVNTVLGERAFEKGVQTLTKNVAKNPFVRRAAKQELNLAIKKGLVNASDDVAKNEYIQRFAAKRAAKLVDTLGAEVSLNLTGVALMDFNRASSMYETGSKEWWDEIKRSAKTNAALSAVILGVPALRVRGGIPFVGGVRKDTQELLANMAKNADTPEARQAMREAFVRDGEEAGRRFDLNELLAQNSPLRQADDVIRPQNIEEAVERAAAEAVERNADDVARATVNNADAVRPQNVDEAIERAAVRTVEQNADEAVRAATPPETRVIPGEEVRAGENARAGERTEFRRDNAETAREQARNKRTTNNRQQATQESFDSDFEAFERKVAENHAKAEELKRQIRAASGEEKEALQEQLKQLDKEVKSAYNKASLRYHPDRGGSNEWMGKFNSVYDDYKNGKFKSRGFRSAESSTRANTGARERYRAEYSSGGNGSTPPPRGGATEAGERGFRRPQGKAKKATRTVYNVEDLVNKKKPKVSERERIKEAYHATKRKVVNSMASFEDANLKNVKTNHEKWKINNAAIDKTRRSGAIAGRSVREGQLRANGRRFSGTVERVGADGKTYKIENGKSLVQIYDGMDEKTEAAFDAYLLLKHAPDRIREGTPIFDRIKLASNESLNDVNVINREADRLLKEHPEFAKKAEEIYQYTRNELENRVNAGLLSQKTASKWLHDHPFYVPTGRDGYFNAVHGNHKGVIGADSLKSAKGSDLDIRSIKEQLAEATNRNWRDITTNDLLEKNFGDQIQTMPAADNGWELLNDTVGLAKSADGQKHYAKIFRNGDMHRVEIDKRYYDDLVDLNKNGSIGPVADTIAHASGKFSGVFKKLVTAWNPFFLPKNFSRDFQDALINTRQTKEFVECLGPAMKELRTDGEFLKAFRDTGVSQSNLVNLDEALTNGKGGILGKAADGFATLNEATETFPRLAEFMATIKKAGYEHLDDIPPEKYTELIDQAAANAADVTVNFARSGSVGKNLNKGLVPFFNPSVQGWSKFTRNFREQRGLKQLLGTIGKASALGAGTIWINNTLLHDNPNYQQISARDKATNIIIAWPPCTTDENGNLRMNNETDTFVKIPRGRFASVYGLPVVNANNENDMGYAEMVKVAKDQVAPVDPLESSIYSPFLLAGKNETWYGSPIVPESIRNETNPSQEYDQNTSYIGRALGKATEKLPTKLQISPKKADYIIDAETGIAGDFILPAFTPSKQGSGNAFERFVTHPAGNVIKKQFTIDATTQNDLSTRFYNELQKAGDNNRLANATKEDADEYKRMNAYSTEASDLTSAIRDMQASNRPDKQEAVRGLQKVRNQLMLDALNGNDVPAKAKTVDAVQKYVGTTYAISNFGSSSDKEAMKVYGLAKYGKLSDADMAKRIDADKDFYKGVQAIGNLEDKAAKSGVKTNTTLSKAVALASIGASDDLYGAYAATKKSRTESADKMTRAKTYMSTGGSTNEFVKLESARKSLGKLSDYDKEAELDKINDQLAKGEITQDEYYTKQGEINYNANISYVGLATSLAEANAPERGYRLYDIKDKNIQKGINLAAMGYTARDYREMAKAVDSNGNGYPSKQEIVDYVANSDVEDKATLFDALYYYKSSRNPFGTPTNYTREQAAAAGKAKGVKAITDETGDISLKADESSSKSGYKRGYRRRGYRRRGYRSYSGSSAKATVPKPKTIKATSFAKGEALVSTSKSSSAKKTNKVTPPQLKRVQAKIDLPTKR